MAETGLADLETVATLGALATPFLLQGMNYWIGQERIARDKARYDSLERLIGIIDRLSVASPDPDIERRRRQRVLELERVLERRLRDIGREIEAEEEVELELAGASGLLRIRSTCRLLGSE